MIFWGGKHTENPDSWIFNFKDSNYTILSIILTASLQTLILVESEHITKMERYSLFSTRSRQTISVLVFVAALLTSSISILTPHALAQTSPPAVSMNMTSGNTTSTSNNSTNATTTATGELGNKKTFYVFSEEMEGVNETKLGFPGDVYAPSVLAANEGDTVTIHFYNLDPNDRHTFTMVAPYNINKDVGPLENTTITFKAKRSWCI